MQPTHTFRLGPKTRLGINALMVGLTLLYVAYVFFDSHMHNGATTPFEIVNIVLLSLSDLLMAGTTLLSRTQIFPDRCNVRSLTHPVHGLSIRWTDVKEVRFGHHIMGTNQLICLTYCDAKGRLRNTAGFANTNDDLRAILPLLPTDCTLEKTI